MKRKKASWIFYPEAPEFLVKGDVTVHPKQRSLRNKRKKYATSATMTAEATAKTQRWKRSLRQLRLLRPLRYARCVAYVVRVALYGNDAIRSVQSNRS